MCWPHHHCLACWLSPATSMLGSQVSNASLPCWLLISLVTGPHRSDRCKKSNPSGRQSTIVGSRCWNTFWFWSRPSCQASGRARGGEVSSLKEFDKKWHFSAQVLYCRKRLGAFKGFRNLIDPAAALRTLRSVNLERTRYTWRMDKSNQPTHQLCNHLPKWTALSGFPCPHCPRSDFYWYL